MMLLLLAYYATEPKTKRDILPWAALVDFVLLFWTVFIYLI